MNLLGRLWRIDLIRHSMVAAITTAAITAVVLLAATGIDSDGNRLDRSGPLVESASAIDERNRDAARLGGSEQGREAGRRQAERDATALPASATESAGYELGYRQGWNLLIWQASQAAPLQLRSGADGAQWIELLR